MSVVIRVTRAVQRSVHGPDEQRQRAGARAVGHDDAHALARRGPTRAQLLGDERGAPRPVDSTPSAPPRRAARRADSAGDSSTDGARAPARTGSSSWTHSRAGTPPGTRGQATGGNSWARSGAADDGPHDVRRTDQAPRPRPRSPAARGARRPGRSPDGCTPPSPTCRSSRRTGTCRRPGWPTTRPFSDPTSLLISPDHYVFRLLHAAGRAARRTSGVGGRPLDGARPRAAPGGCSASTGRASAARRAGSGWRACSPTSSASPSGLSAETADAIYDRIADAIAAPAFRPRALMRPLRHRGPRDDRRPGRRPATTTGPARRRRRSPPGSCRPSAPTATSSPAAPTSPTW